MGISAISAIELFRMIRASKVNAENVDRLKFYMNAFRVFPFSKSAARALAMKATCVIDSTAEFKRVPGLLLSNWRKAR
ncbi:MAG: hypothetical protein HZB71_14745 [Betaproteobacteria bacterium]|nr:hypothetical protein [Betaproteobacteria bacterium]